MSANVRIFQGQLEAFSKKLKLNIRLVTTKIVIDAWSRITARTPVDTGRARASWNVKEGSPATTAPEKGNYGTPTLPALDFSGEKSVFITTSLDYVRYLEKGSSQQAPAGMVAITLAELESEVASVVNSLP